MSRESVLVIAAHPDDEILGAGGTLARHAAVGDQVDILILAQGASSRTTSHSSTEDIGALKQSALAAAATIGAHEVRFGDLPDNRLDSLDLIDVVRLVEENVARCAPSVVYTHHGGDLNIDHRIAFEAVMTACRPLPGSTIVSIYTFEVPSSTEWSLVERGLFNPTTYINIRDTLGVKLNALDSYEQEMRPFPHPRSKENVRSLAAIRGAESGLEAAEAFVTVRCIER